jgi:hypothetical protein
MSESRIVIECACPRQRAAVATLISTALRHAGIVVTERAALSPSAWSATVERARFVAEHQGAPLALLLTRPVPPPVTAESIEAAARSTC